MSQTLTLYQTTVGKKALVAVSGFVLFGFVVGHMLGNLQVFLGPDTLNAYAQHLRDFGPLLWVVRLVLLAAFGLHIVTTVQLWLESRQVRPVGYRLQRDAATSYAARTMILSGPMIAAFVLYHLAHFTWPGVAMSVGYEHSHGDVYANVVSGFSVGWVTLLYVIAQGLLGLHLMHGATSLLQTLGVSHPQYDAALRIGAQAVALVVVLGNVAIPVFVWLGFVR